MTSNDAPYQKDSLDSFEDIYSKFKSKQRAKNDNQKILDELQNVRTELQDIRSELSFLKNSLGNHFLVKGKWIHINHFKPIFLGKD